MRVALALIVAASLLPASAIRSEDQYDLSEALVHYARLDYAVAFRMLLPMAKRGNAVAQETLGFMYLRGEGVPAEAAQAFNWFKLAAEAGRPDAEFALGELYRDGRGVLCDGNVALFWFRRAADHGMTDALVALAQLYRGKNGVPPNPAARSTLLLRAADLGSAEAMYAIGLQYAGAEKYERNDIEALKWLHLAYLRGTGPLRDEAARARATVAERLMPLQVQMALAKSHDWLASHGPP